MVSISTAFWFLPSRMIEPLPKALSICDRAASSALVLSTEDPSTRRRLAWLTGQFLLAQAGREAQWAACGRTAGGRVQLSISQKKNRTAGAALGSLGCRTNQSYTICSGAQVLFLFFFGDTARTRTDRRQNARVAPGRRLPELGAFQRRRMTVKRRRAGAAATQLLLVLGEYQDIEVRLGHEIRSVDFELCRADLLHPLPQKLTSLSGAPLSTTIRKSLIPPAQFAPVVRT